jgi:hypothetical protein
VTIAVELSGFDSPTVGRGAPSPCSWPLPASMSSPAGTHVDSAFPGMFSA